MTSVLGGRSRSFTHAHPQRRGGFKGALQTPVCSVVRLCCGWMEDRAKRLHGSGGTKTDWTE